MMLAFTNQYLAVLDACVLAPMPVCDTLLRLAEEPAFYKPKWSEDIWTRFIGRCFDGTATPKPRQLTGSRK